jgi:hypothetical protein
MTATHIEQVLAIVRQLRDSSWYWLSNSGKGDIGVEGAFVGIRKSVRGLTILVQTADGKNHSVSWRVSQAVADSVLAAV